MIDDGTFTLSYLIANILYRVLILIPLKSVGISKKVLKVRVNSLYRSSYFKFLALCVDRRVYYYISKLDYF